MISSEYDRRAAVIVALRAGRAPAEIIDFLKLPKSTVYAVARRFFKAEAKEEDSAAPARCPQDRSRVKKRNHEFLEQLQTTINEDPSISMRTLAKKMKVDPKTIRTAVHDDLHCKSYVLKVRQTLSEATKAKRLERCNLLLTSLKHAASGRIRFFSDEKIFTIDAKVNRRNDRWIARDPEDVPVVGRTKFPASLHVLLVISSEGDVMPPHFFEKGQTITKEVYQNVLANVVKPWMEQVAVGRPYIFQQDGAPAHTSHFVQNWLADNLEMFWSKEFWPPSSPDLNPLDYYAWGVLQRQTNRCAHDSVDSLRTAIIDAISNINKDHVRIACEQFRSRVEAVVDNSGGWIE